MFPKRIAIAFVELALLAVIFGCSSSPTLNQSSIDEIKTYTMSMMTTPAPGVEYTAIQRNNFIDNQIMLLNIRYKEYITKLGVDKKSIDTGYDIGTLGLSVAGTLTGGVQAKQNLAAATSLLTGTKISIDKNFYFEQTLPVLVAGMDNRRKEILIRILLGRQNPISVYSFAQAQTDITEYEIAGTLDGGIKNLQKQVGAQEQKLDLKLEELAPATAEQISDAKKINFKIAQLKNDPNSLSEVNGILVTLGSKNAPYGKYSDALKELTERFRDMTPNDIPAWKAVLKVQ